MRILLIRPRPDPETIGLQSLMVCEPLELEYLAAAVGEGHEVVIRDLILDRRSLRSLLDEHRPDIAGFTAYISHVKVVRDLCDLVKQWDPGTLTVVGGVHAEVIPSDFSWPSIDLVVHGNALATFREIVERWSAGEKSVSSLREGLAGVWREGKPRPTMGFMPLLPHPNRAATRLYRSRYYYLLHQPCATVKTSLGCPYSCEFCFCRTITQGTYWVRELEDVFAELESITEPEVYMVDDNFLVSRERVLAFCDGLEARGIRKRFLIYGRADFIADNEDVMARFVACGLRAVIVGMESFKNEELDGYGKRLAAETSERAAAILNRVGVDCYATLILRPEWDDQDFRDLSAWLRRLGIHFVNLQPLTPLPGTSLLARFEKELIIPREEFAKWDLAHLCIAPQKLSAGQYYARILRTYSEVCLSRASLAHFIARYGVIRCLKLVPGLLQISAQYAWKAWRFR